MRSSLPSHHARLARLMCGELRVYTMPYRLGLSAVDWPASFDKRATAEASRDIPFRHTSVTAPDM